MGARRSGTSAPTDVDVSGLATQIRCPTAIFHATDEPRIPFDEARTLASLIPGSVLIPLDSGNHLMRQDEPAWSVFLDELDRFLDAGGDQLAAR